MNAAACEVNSDPDDISTRIRALLANVRCIRGEAFSKEAQEGRSLLEKLALAEDLDRPRSDWTLLQCADVVEFLHSIDPADGVCICGHDDVDGVNLACGYMHVLQEVEKSLRSVAAAPAVRP
jgi:hypothetical protein